MVLLYELAFMAGQNTTATAVMGESFAPELRTDRATHPRRNAVPTICCMVRPVGARPCPRAGGACDLPAAISICPPPFLTNSLVLGPLAAAPLPSPPPPSHPIRSGAGEVPPLEIRPVAWVVITAG